MEKWGFVPGWWKQGKPPTHCFNARSEEAPTKPMWKYSFQHARCLVPAEGWYEWSAAERTDERTGEIRTYRQPHYIHRADDRLIAFAGLMSFWYPDPDSMVLTCAIVTKPAAKSTRTCTTSRPSRRWSPAGQADFESYAVSTRLNAAKEDDERLIERAAN